MSLKFLASLFIMVFRVYHPCCGTEYTSSASPYRRKEQEFWDREKKANSVRKKTLDGLDYVKIPLEKLPMNALSEDEKAREYKELLTYLSTQPVVNLTGFTNTDLKLEYGTAERYTTAVPV